MEVFRRPGYRVGEKRELPVLNAEQKSALEGLIRQAGTKVRPPPSCTA
jgi:hypothetical protein